MKPEKDQRQVFNDSFMNLSAEILKAILIMGQQGQTLTVPVLLFVTRMMQGLQWVLLAEEEIAPAIIGMDGRRSRCAKSEHQVAMVGDGHTQDVNNAKLLRKLEAQGV